MPRKEDCAGIATRVSMLVMGVRPVGKGVYWPDGGPLGAGFADRHMVASHVSSERV